MRTGTSMAALLRQTALGRKAAAAAAHARRLGSPGREATLPGHVRPGRGPAGGAVWRLTPDTFPRLSWRIEMQELLSTQATLEASNPSTHADHAQRLGAPGRVEALFGRVLPGCGPAGGSSGRLYLTLGQRSPGWMCQSPSPNSAMSNTRSRLNHSTCACLQPSLPSSSRSAMLAFRAAGTAPHYLMAVIAPKLRNR